MDIAKVNVHPTERIVSATFGGFLLIRSLSYGSLGRAILGLVLLYRGISGHSFLYQALDVSTTPRQKQPGSTSADLTPEIERSITVNRPASDLQSFWREPQHLSHIMGDTVKVTEVDKIHTHWQVNGPLSIHMRWDSSLVEDHPGELIRWESIAGSSLPNQVLVRFHPAPGNRGTETTLHLRFEPPGGIVGKKMAHLLHRISYTIADQALRRFKSLAETGEIPTLAHNPSARAGSYAQKGEQPYASALLERS